jgi:hypothetical protein
MFWFRLLDDGVDVVVALRRMQNASVTEPEIRRAEIAGRLGDRIARAGELLLPDPAGVIVCGADGRPAVAPFFDGDRLAAQ